MKYDAIVVGAGAGGGVACSLLAQAGLTVLLLEKGAWLKFGERDHLRNQRYSRYGVNAGPLLEERREFEGKVVSPLQGEFNNNASCVGSGTAVYGAQAWRFHELDFRMASEYGVPSGSSNIDWPFSYADLAPYYESVEQAMGVCGHAEGYRHLPEFNKPYPMPAMPLGRAGKAFLIGAEKLGWHTNRVPLLINSIERDGRGACVHCQNCVGFTCPSDAKNGTQNTMIPRGLASGNLTLVTDAQVTKILWGADGEPVGVRFFDASGSHDVFSQMVVLAGGAIETPRLLLASRAKNEYDQIGRNLQGHYYAGATGLFKDDLWDGFGPGVNLATTQFSHHNEGVLSGGMLADDFIISPINMWAGALPPELPKWGAENKAFFRQNYRRIHQIKGPIHEISNQDCRVTVSSQTDKFGMPIAALSGTTHPETVRTANFLDEKAREWLRASGAVKVWGGGHTLRLSAGQHQAGSCRMGEDRKASAVDTSGRVHGYRNLFVADGSVHPTNGGFNPVLTILAMSWRTTSGIIERLS